MLCAIDTALAGYIVKVPWKGPKPTGWGVTSSVTVSALAYVDDTVWVAHSKAGAHCILKLAMEFFALNNIEVDAKKTVLMVLNPVSDPQVALLLFGKPALPVLPIPVSEGTRYLGCHISADER